MGNHTLAEPGSISRRCTRAAAAIASRPLFNLLPLKGRVSLNGRHFESTLLICWPRFLKSTFKARARPWLTPTTRPYGHMALHNQKLTTTTSSRKICNMFCIFHGEISKSLLKYIPACKNINQVKIWCQIARNLLIAWKFHSRHRSSAHSLKSEPRARANSPRPLPTATFTHFLCVPIKNKLVKRAEISTGLASKFQLREESE